MVASDAFFPFADGLEAAVAAGATAVIQPGGSMRDEEVIAAADAAGHRDGVHRHAPFPALTAMTTLPLSGIRVLDLTRVLSGPFCSMLLGDLGAEVIKVETPGEGDTVRHQGASKDGLSWYFANYNRNKRSITLNLRADEGRDILARLIATERCPGRQLSPGVLAAMGFTDGAAAGTQPAPGARQHHRLRRHRSVSRPPSFDFIAQAMSGFMSVNGAADQPPMRSGPPVSDLIAGPLRCSRHRCRAAARRTNRCGRLRLGQPDRGVDQLSWASWRPTIWRPADCRGDLPEHRKEAMEACLRQGMFPMMMEHLPASDDEAIPESLKMVDQADIYLLILAHRYGYVPKADNPTQISVTEHEYNRAIERKIPCLTFVMHEDHPVKAADVEKGEGAVKLEAFKNRALLKVTNFFISPADLRAHVINSLSHHREARSDVFHYVSEIPAAARTLHRAPLHSAANAHADRRQTELNC